LGSPTAVLCFEDVALIQSNKAGACFGDDAINTQERRREKKKVGIELEAIL
jgi:hypothetical protein